MKKTFFTFLLLPALIFAQNVNNLQNDVANRATNDGIRINYKTEDKGNPYLYDEWKEGYLIINDSVVSPQKKMQVDLQKGELIVGLGSERGMIIDDKSITGFAINDAKNTGKHFYVRLEPSQFEDLDRDSHFYELVSRAGKTNYLIKDVQRYLYDPNKSRGYQTENSLPMEWKTRTRYYIKNGNDIYVRTKLSKKSILKILADKSSEVKKYASSNKISFKKENDVEQLLSYYHSI